MRINIYAQEFTDDVRLADKVDEDGRIHRCVRFFLDTGAKLLAHSTPDDDDRSAVCFWIPREPAEATQLVEAFESAANLIRAYLADSGVADAGSDALES